MSEEKLIAFVPRRSRIRPYKIAKALRYLDGVRTVLICEEKFYDPSLHDGTFDKVRFYKKAPPFAQNKYVKILDDRLNPKHSKLAEIVREESPDLIHAFCEPYDHIQYLLKHVDIPVVMSDGADFSGISAGIENLSERVFQKERYCLENVDGLCYKGPPEVMDYYRRHDVRVEAEELNWFDHCDEELFQPVKEAENPELHLVYTGNISTDPSVKYCYYIPLAKALSRQRIHFHVYPNPYQFKTSQEYRELDDEDPYFHFHYPKPMKDLIEEIAQYDWGLWVHARDPSLRTSVDKMKTGIGNKFFSYLEAGLPVLISDSREYGVKVAEEHGVGLPLADEDWSRIGELLKGTDGHLMLENVERERKALSLQNNAWKLEEFYRRVLENKEHG